MENDKKVVKVKLVKHEWPDERARRHKKNLKAVGFVVLMLLMFVSGCFVGGGLAMPEDEINHNKLNAVLNLMENNWYFGKDIDDLTNVLLDKAISGITTQENDIHTQYMDSEYAKSFLGSMEGNVVGIGVQYSTATSDNVVLKVFTHSPAEEAGMLAGDIIRKVDGVAVEDIEDLSSAVKGKEGTYVNITVQRGSQLIDLNCERRNVETSVNGYIKGDVGVLEILSVAENSADAVHQVLENFEQQNIHKVIVDVRGNGGGYLTSVVDIASYFLPKESVVLQEQDKKGNVVQDKTSNAIEPYRFDKVAVLIDGGSASAAEVLALALKEQINATLIGDVSYGKGTIQTTQPFSDGSMLKYTKAIWLSPQGNWINGVGITPDILVETPPALLMPRPTEFEAVGVDTVSNACMSMQVYLDYLGYDVDRQDGYFSEKTLSAMHSFEKDYGLSTSDTLDSDLLTFMLSKVIYESKIDESKDIQMVRALEEMK